MPSDIPTKKCPQCGSDVPVQSLSCPLCRYAWFREEPGGRSTEKVRKLILGVVITCGILLLSFCLLYVLLLSFRTAGR